MKRGKLNIVLDLQFGSTGKGKLAGFLAGRADVAVCDFQTNAGHTVEMDDGEKHVFQQIPVAAINPDCQLLINPGASITLKKLLDEIETHGVQDRLMIHPHAAIVTEKALEWERENLKRISSTLKGVGATAGLKAMRSPDMKLAKDCPELKSFLGDTTERLHEFLRARAMCLGEAAQGFDLSLNHGFRYPYCTSRDVTTCSFLSNAGVPPQLVGDVYGTLRTYPIRVGHQFEADGKKVGDSGPYYEDQVEITWEQVAKMSGSTEDLRERTTVTGKVRRVFTFSHKQVVRALRVCAPNRIFVNFINHIRAGDCGKRSWSELSEDSRKFVKGLGDTLADAPEKCVVSHIGTGPKMSQMVEMV